MTKKLKLSQAEIAAIQDEEERKARVFQSIGAFIFQFSQLEFTLRVVLAKSLNLPEAHFDVVTSPYDFRTLCGVTEAVLIQTTGQQEKSIKEFFSNCMRLSDQRNRIAHGLWADDGAGMTARHVARNSLKAVFHFDQPEAVDKLITETAKLTEEAETLMHQLLFVSGITPAPGADV